jgi:D-arabinan exo alpha-(1,3)/(1,5)-arabinofuranosidase (non-reducing end)
MRVHLVVAIGVLIAAVTLGVTMWAEAPAHARSDPQARQSGQPAPPARQDSTGPLPAMAPSIPDLLGLAQLKDWEARRSSSNNQDLNSNDDSKRPIPGETVILADLGGPGVVTHIWLTVAANEYGWPRLLRLRVYYDGSPVPSVDAPVGDFFGVGHGFERPVKSLMVRASSSGRSRNCYWPMPFRRSCRITITNEGRRRISNLYYHVDWARLRTLPAGTAYFHARYRQALPAETGKPYEVLRVTGRGQYVGTVFSVVQNQAGWFGEGDDYFFVDGDSKARIGGTGTEDYFNDAWSLRVDDGLFAGVPVAEGTGVGSRMTAYRWHVADPVPFARSLVFDFEHKGWTYNPDGSVRSAFEERADLFSSVAFWYQLGIATDQPEPPYGAARLPHGNARQIEVEDDVAGVKVERGNVEVQKEVFWSKDLLFFKAEGPGSALHVPLDVPDESTYELVAQLAHSPDYGTYRVLLDGKAPVTSGELEHEPGAVEASQGDIDGYYIETYVAVDHLIGWINLTKGRHTVSFVCTGRNPQSAGYALGIDTFVLAKLVQGHRQELSDASRRAAVIRAIGERGPSGAGQLPAVGLALPSPDDEVREAAVWALGQMGPAAAPVVGDLTRALSDADPVVRGLAALALRDVGSAAGRSLEALIARLKDDDVNVRMMAAQAIGRQGATASSAIDALIDACRRKDEHVHVLRSLATALGQIGPSASRALPTLRDLARIPRVQWAAEEAIGKIEGRKES